MKAMQGIALAPDDLKTPTVGPWAEEKYSLVECYARIFATAMKNKWDARVYIDLYGGSGRAAIRGTERVVETPAMSVLRIPDPFDRYVYCELDREKLDSLRARVGASHAAIDVQFVDGDSNANAERIRELIPTPSPNFKVLTFCYVDPFRLENLDFATIRTLAAMYVDFLVLIPTGMDPGRNEMKYSRAGHSVVAAFTGRENWRSERTPTRKLPFGDFVALQFGESMKALGYRFAGLHETHEMFNKRNRGLYRLAVFSRKDLGSRFWNECRKYANPQTSLF
jgi:three-Cys-motif partner protein